MDFLIELIANFIGNLIEEILISLPFTNSIVAKRKYRRKNNLFVINEYILICRTTAKEKSRRSADMF